MVTVPFSPNHGIDDLVRCPVTDAAFLALNERGAD